MIAKKPTSTSAPDDENPEWTAEDFDRATPHISGKPVSMEEFRAAVATKMGRPKSEHPKQAIKLRLDADVIAHFQADGPGWQTRINAALRRVARLPAKPPATRVALSRVKTPSKRG